MTSSIFLCKGTVYPKVFPCFFISYMVKIMNTVQNCYYSPTNYCYYYYYYYRYFQGKSLAPDESLSPTLSFHSKGDLRLYTMIFIFRLSKHLDIILHNVRQYHCQMACQDVM